MWGTTPPEELGANSSFSLVRGYLKAREKEKVPSQRHGWTKNKGIEGGKAFVVSKDYERGGELVYSARKKRIKEVGQARGWGRF